MTKKLTAKIGTYQKDGQTKGRYVNLGVILSNDKGEYILLDPSVSLSGVLAMQNAMADRPRDKVMVSIFDDDNRQQGGGQQQSGGYQQQQGGGPGGDLDGDIPFNCEWRV